MSELLNFIKLISYMRTIVGIFAFHIERFRPFQAGCFKGLGFGLRVMVKVRARVSVGVGIGFRFR